MFHASLDTRHFEFDTYGETEEHARALMAELWANHCIQYEQDDNFHEFEDGVRLTEFAIGGMFRDLSPVVVNRVTPRMMDEISLARKDIRGIDWENVAPHGTLKDGKSFAVPVKAIFGPNEVDQDEVGPYSGTMIIDVRNGKLFDYSVGDWQRDDEEDGDEI